MNNNQPTRLRAWSVFCGEQYDGCLLVFAASRNEAKNIGYKKGPYGWDEYIYLRAIRAPKHDIYANGSNPYIVVTNDELPDGAEPFYSDEEI